MTTDSEFRLGQRLSAMRAAQPLIHNITNYVAMNIMANVLLAIGASPAMVHAPEEAAEFACIAAALTVNIGTLSKSWVEGMILAAEAAGKAGKPWVLDPVAAGATRYRVETARALIALRPTVIRGNASEILALHGLSGTGRGVDSTDTVAFAQDAARNLALDTGAIVAVTGAVDFVTDGTRGVHIANGHILMPRVTALGCSLTGVVGAFLAVDSDTFGATVAALTCFGVAGELAERGAAGPGSFAVRFLDVLAALRPDQLEDMARIERAQAWSA